ncbi:MAG: response regulator [Bacteroidia bacterium]|nr:response regulator [Bacteroidia bacterium]NNL34051.1 response regulator [Flavobacteriaceae bacterium]
MKYLVLVLFLFCCSMGLGQDIYEIDTKYPVHEIDNYLKIYTDSTASLSPEIILKDTSSNYIHGKDQPGYFLNRKLLWGKVKLYATDSLKGWTLHFKNIFFGTPAWIKGNGKVDIYAYADEDLIFHKKTGYGYSSKERDVAENWVLNRIRLDDIPLNTQVTLVIRAEGSKFGYPPFFRLNLRGPTQAHYHELNQFNNSFFIFMFGVTFIILLYHILQYLYLRDVIFLHFSLWVLVCCMTMLMATGGILDSVHRFGYEFWLIFANGVYFLFWFFGRSFIQSKTKFPLLDKLILGLATIMVIEVLTVLFLVLFGLASPSFLDVGIHAELHVIMNILGLILSIAIATRKDNFARYFGVGASIGLMLLVFGSMWSAGWIKYPGFDAHSWAVFAQIVIFSFGIAYRRQVMMKQNNEEKLKAQLNSAEIERMKDLDEIKTRFFANISHEFRTPLSLIKGPLNRAKNQSNTPDITLSPKAFEIIDNNTNRLQGLIDQLLDLSKLESGKVHLSLKYDDIIKHLRSLIFSFESMAERKNISLNTQFPAEIKSAVFDKDKLEKIVGNLLSNAFKYTPSNGSVTVIVGHNKKNITIEIIDTGKGINKEELKRVFDRFYRVEGSEEKGSGIGLSLVKELVDLHNGNLSVDSVVGQGTSFKVTLPITLEGLPKTNVVIEDISKDVDVEFRPDEPVTNETPISNNGLPSNLPVALIVEDNNDLRFFISDIIKEKYEVLTAENGLQGERMAFEHIPDIVISDIMMPKKDGYELCHSLKVNPKTSHIPIIMLTAKAGQDSKIEGLTQGADAYLTKPFDDKELLLRMKNLIDSRKKLWDHFKALDMLLVDDIEVNSIDDKFLQDVFSCIKNNLDNEQFSVEDIARTVGFSRSQLHRKLKALSDKSANQLVVEVRLNEAHRLLKQKAGSVSEIAYSVGYSNLSYFTKSFKEKFGTLPSKV